MKARGAYSCQYSPFLSRCHTWHECAPPPVRWGCKREVLGRWKMKARGAYSCQYSSVSSPCHTWQECAPPPLEVSVRARCFGKVDSGSERGEFMPIFWVFDSSSYIPASPNSLLRNHFDKDPETNNRHIDVFCLPRCFVISCMYKRISSRCGLFFF